MMSTTEAAADELCASCGIAGGGDDKTKLKRCGACGLVRYCSIACQRDHRTEHKNACKKRVAELRDELLFKQPESSHEGDCAICLLPLPLGTNKSTMQSCCCKTICNGCLCVNWLREEKQLLGHKCPFCRQPVPWDDAGIDRLLKKRVEANDPVAISRKASKCATEGDYGSALVYGKKAAGMGDIAAHFLLSTLYSEGHGVEIDKKKERYHSEVAAIGGHPTARYNLAINALQKGGCLNMERAVKHLIIAANLGCDHSIEKLKECYAAGDVNKGEFAAALRAHHAAVDAMKSPYREQAEAARQMQLRDALRTAGGSK
mmetsp:Transcript_24863/g.37663  ORF Transcript_24863/g.37663 Transcript_24863/m.37663 type:complete len:317 (-) Transcript_24863:50-1000(-)|eukprot:scaffold5856_cov159-Skeletonema_dohrnii-CCMP3373.AAC.5